MSFASGSAMDKSDLPETVRSQSSESWGDEKTLMGIGGPFPNSRSCCHAASTRETHLSSLGCGLGISVYKKLLGDSNTWHKLRSMDL
jgi:hypothetical protein